MMASILATLIYEGRLRKIAFWPRSTQRPAGWLVGILVLFPDSGLPRFASQIIFHLSSMHCSNTILWMDWKSSVILEGFWFLHTLIHNFSNPIHPSSERIIQFYQGEVTEVWEWRTTYSSKLKATIPPYNIKRWTCFLAHYYFFLYFLSHFVS